MGVTKISPESQALSPNKFLRVEPEQTQIKAPPQLENEDTGADFAKSKELFSYTLEDLLPPAADAKPSKPHAPAAAIKSEPAATAEKPNLSSAAEGPDRLEPPAAAAAERPELEDDLNKLPLMKKLLLQLEMIIPLLVKLEQGHKLTKNEVKDLMEAFSDDQIGNIYFGGLISFGGNMLGAAVSILAGKEVGQMLSGLIQGISMITEGAKKKAETGYQLESFRHQDCRDLVTTAEKLHEKILEAVKQADSLSYLRG